MKNLPGGIHTFSKIMEGNYLYVDKTNDIHKLISSGGGYYFISRPRRFGKSLLISTLKEIFSGNKKLFKGLWIYDKIQWKSYPVIHIDFSHISFQTSQSLEKELSIKLNKIARTYHVKLDQQRDYKGKFADLVEKLSTKEKVVILIDEYDKPIIDFIETEKVDTALANQTVLKNFYAALKAADEYIHFVFITGVSKFSRMSIFSDLNNLNDITIDDKFSTLLGITHDELLTYFADRIDPLSKKMKIPGPDFLNYIKQWYNGYSWDGCHFLYNPFSIIYFFSKNRFGNYWFATGTPTFLIHHIKNRQKDIISLEREEVDEAIFESFDVENLEVVSMLFQTGYLTIKEIKLVGIKSQYVLSYPNQEVKESFLKHFLADYTREETGVVGSKILDLVKTITTDELESFFTIIKSIFASIPSPIFIRDREAYYHTIIYLVLQLLGANIGVEVYTNKGRIDAVIETADHIYILEFKMGTPAEALSQIEDKKYYEKFLSTGKPIRLIGVGFAEKERNISGYIEKKVFTP